MKAVSWRPEDRYRTATEIGQDVRRWMADEPVSCIPDRWNHRVARFLRHHAKASISTAIMCLVVLGIAIGAYVLVQQAAARESQLQADVAAREKRESDRYVHLLEARRIRTSTHSSGWSIRAWDEARQAADFRRGADARDEAVAALIGMDATSIKSLQFGTAPDPRPEGNRESAQVPFLAFTPDGGRLVMAGLDGHTHIWKADDDGLQTFSTPGPGPLAFLDDGSPVQLAPRDPVRYQLWDIVGGKPIREFVSPVAGLPSFDREKAPALVAVSPQAEFVTAAVPLPENRSALVVWNGKSGAVLHQGDALPRLMALIVTQDGLVAAGDEHGIITVWAVDRREPLVRLEANNVSINCLAFTRDLRRTNSRREPANPIDGWLLAAGDAGGTITIWDLRRRIPRSYCRGSRHDIYSVAFSSDGMTLMSGETSASTLWDVGTGAVVCQLGEPFRFNRVLAVAFSPDGRRAAFGTNRLETDQPSVGVWNLQPDRGIRALRGLAGAVAKVTFSPDGRYLAALSATWQVGVWSLDESKLLHCFDVPPGYFVDNADLTFNRDGSRFVFSAGKQATLWDTKTGDQVRRFELPPGLQDCLTFDALGSKLLLFRYETEDAEVGPFTEYPWREHPRVCRLRDLLADQYLKPLWEIKDFPIHVQALRITGQGKLLIVDGFRPTKSTAGARGEHLVAIYDRATLKQLWTVPVKLGRPVADVLGTAINIEGFDTTSDALLDATSGRILRFPFTGAGCLSPHGTYHARSSPENHGLGLYRTGDNEPLVVMGLDDVASYYQIQFSHDGRQVAWPSRDGSVYVADIQEVRRRLAEEVRRRLAELGLGW